MAMDAGEKHGHEPSTPTLAAETAPKPVDDAEAATPKTTRDSMVTVRLSEPPALSLDTSSARDSRLPDSPTLPMTSQSSDEGDLDATSPSRNSTATLSASAEASRSLQDELGEFDDADSDCSDPEEVNWEELEKTEEKQTKDEETDNVCAHLAS